jgi:hypothetical protein
VRGVRINGDLSVSGRDVQKDLPQRDRRLLLWWPLTTRAKKHLLCDLCVFAVSQGYVTVFLKKTTKH